ncbi:HD domain-containing protein [Natranaerobius thermophilus]|uniref:Hydrolase (HAD superfamily) n=1 Tax=Natranaerobius thermophilus (strain ATCC BAA-1301 / DSM 18059 / JW/NM-WN-LF) TaxID=457570 RepID=B2A751_NATTJ|nr:HD domain-containing protein [Natranaerobius thermophilus]ACB85642.1 hydrolase (HAD superfamily) [Natranaerobius thermophilus JW/NM-WN-LF]
MIKGELLETLFEAAHIQRWNDHLRPHNFTELDKQAHKMVLAYVIGKFEEQDKDARIDWSQLIEGGIFEFLQRIMLTDIKPPIYHKLMEESGRELNHWVYEQLKDILKPVAGDLNQKFEQYLFDDNYSSYEKKILRASHYLATNWEFNVIYQFNSHIYGVEETKNKIENELEDHYDLLGVQKLGLKNKTYNFIELVGQLRFQKRWANSPRVPETSVLGHMLLVAIFSYLFSLELSACDKRKYNNFFAGLYHDLPEVMTRDIISPVKKSVKGLDSLINDIEDRQLEEKILPLLPRKWHEELRYFLNDEFATKIFISDTTQKVSTDEINRFYNRYEFSPVDGELIKVADEISAYMEASQSIHHGISSKHLAEAKVELYKKYQHQIISGIELGALFDYFY